MRSTTTTTHSASLLRSPRCTLTSRRAPNFSPGRHALAPGANLRQLQRSAESEMGASPDHRRALTVRTSSGCSMSVSGLRSPGRVLGGSTMLTPGSSWPVSWRGFPRTARFRLPGRGSLPGAPRLAMLGPSSIQGRQLHCTDAHRVALAVLVKICTAGRSCPPAYATHTMFVKKEPERAASSWTVNEVALASLGTPVGAFCAQPGTASSPGCPADPEARRGPTAACSGHVYANGGADRSRAPRPLHPALGDAFVCRRYHKG